MTKPQTTPKYKPRSTQRRGNTKGYPRPERVPQKNTPEQQRALRYNTKYIIVGVVLVTILGLGLGLGLSLNTPNTSSAIGDSSESIKSLKLTRPATKDLPKEFFEKSGVHAYVYKNVVYVYSGDGGLLGLLTDPDLKSPATDLMDIMQNTYESSTGFGHGVLVDINYIYVPSPKSGRLYRFDIADLKTPPKYKDTPICERAYIHAYTDRLYLLCVLETGDVRAEEFQKSILWYDYL